MTAGKLDILIDIRSRLDEVQATTAAMKTLREQTLAGVAGLQAEAVGMRSALQAGTNEAGNLREAIEGAAAQGAQMRDSLSGIERSTQEMAALAAETHNFAEQAQLGVAIGLGEKLVEGLEGAAHKLAAFVENGTESLKHLESEAIALSGSLRAAEPEKVWNWKEAERVGAEALASLRAKGFALGIDFTSLAQNYQINLKSMVEGGVTSMQQQIDLTTQLAQAAASKGLQGFQAVRDITDLLNGRANRTMFGIELGITDADVKAARARGGLFEFFSQKLSAYGEAGAAAANTLEASEVRLKDTTDRLGNAVAKGTFDALKTGLAPLVADLNRPEVAESLRGASVEIGHLVETALALARLLTENSKGLTEMARAAVALGIAFTGFKLAPLLVNGAFTGVPAAVAGVRNLTTSIASMRLVTAEAIATQELEAAAIAKTNIELAASTAAREVDGRSALARMAAMRETAALEATNARIGIGAAQAGTILPATATQSSVILASGGAAYDQALATERVQADVRARQAAMAEEEAAASARRESSMRGFLQMIGLAVGAGLLVKEGIDAWAAGIEAASQRADEFFKKMQSQSVTLRQSLSEADTPVKLAAVQTQLQAQIDAAQAEVNRLTNERFSVSGAINNVVTGGAVQEQLDAAQSQLLILQRQLDVTKDLAGVDSERYRRQFEAAQQEERSASTVAQMQAADADKKKAQQAAEEAIERLQKEIATHRRGAVELSRDQLDLDQRTLTAIEQMLVASGGITAEHVKQNAALREQLQMRQWSQQQLTALAEQTRQAKQAARTPEEITQDAQGRANAADANFRSAFTDAKIPLPDDYAANAEKMNQIAQRAIMGASALGDDESQQFVVKLTEAVRQAVEAENDLAKAKKATSEAQAATNRQQETASRYFKDSQAEVHTLELKTQMNQALARGDQERADALTKQLRAEEMTKAYNEELAKSATAQGKSWGELNKADEEEAWKLVSARFGEKDAQQAVNDAKKDGLAADRDALALAKQQRQLTDEQRRALIEAKREEIAAVKSDPSLTQEEKERRLLPLLEQERKQLEANIAAWREYNKVNQGSTDPNVQRNITQNERSMAQAGKERAALGPSGSLGKGQVGVNNYGGQLNQTFVHQVDSLGTAAQNAGKAFDTGLNTAIQGTSQALEAVIMRTGSWKQAMGSAVRSGIQGLIELGVKTVAHYAMLGAQMLAHKILGTTLKTEDTAETVANAAVKTAALTPATLLESIGSWGVAAAVGAAALLAAFALVGAFEGGGHTGGREGEIAGVVHGEEFVVHAAGVRAAPAGLLEAINDRRVQVTGSGSAVSSGSLSAFSSAAASQQGAGGRGAAPNIKAVFVTSEAEARREMLNSSEFDHAFIRHMDRHGVVRRRT